MTLQPPSPVDLAATLAQDVVARAIEQTEQQGAQCLDKLRTAYDKLRPLPTLAPSEIADAYDLVTSAFTGRGADWNEARKFARLAIRETLILVIGAPAGRMSDIAFETAVQTAFRRQLEPALLSEFHLARRAICQLGRRRKVFLIAAPKIFSAPLSHKQLQDLFVPYAKMYDNNRRRHSRSPGHG